jgi:hypothetical protein
MENIDLQSWIRPMEPAEFSRLGADLLNEIDQATSYGPAVPAVEYSRGLGVKDVFLKVIDTALDSVQLDVPGQEQEATFVSMLRASGTAPERLRHFREAERVAAHYHHVARQLESAPRSPILSVFVNTVGVDFDCGAVVQAANTNGAISWRSDPFLDGGGEPEVVIGLHDWPGPVDGQVGQPSRSRERAVMRGGDFSPVDRPDDECTTIVDGWATVLTDDHDPEFLIMPKDEEGREDYQAYLREVLSNESRLASDTYLVAVGEAATGRLVARFEQEIAPFLSDSKVGALEAKRLLFQMHSALAAPTQAGRATTIGPHPGIKRSIESSLSEEMTAILAERGVTSDKYFPSLLMDDCVEAGIQLDENQLVAQICWAIARHHVGEAISYGEFADAVAEEVAETLAADF